MLKFLNWLKRYLTNRIALNNIRVVINENRRPSGEHSRRYNSPVSDKIAVLMPNDNMSNRDVVLHYKDGGLRHISELYAVSIAFSLWY